MAQIYVTDKPKNVDFKMAVLKATTCIVQEIFNIPQLQYKYQNVPFKISSYTELSR